AAAAIPHELIDSTTLLGPVERIADRMAAYAAAGATTLTLSPGGFTLDERIAALRAGTEALERAGLASGCRAVAGGPGAPGAGGLSRSGVRRLRGAGGLLLPRPRRAAASRRRGSAVCWVGTAGGGGGGTPGVVFCRLPGVHSPYRAGTSLPRRRPKAIRRAIW